MRCCAARRTTRTWPRACSSCSCESCPSPSSPNSSPIVSSLSWVHSPLPRFFSPLSYTDPQPTLSQRWCHVRGKGQGPPRVYLLPARGEQRHSLRHSGPLAHNPGQQDHQHDDLRKLGTVQFLPCCKKHSPWHDTRTRTRTHRIAHTRFSLYNPTESWVPISCGNRPTRRPTAWSRSTSWAASTPWPSS